MTINYRADFDIPRDICYLNAAYMTPQPRDVVTATMRGATLRSQPWHITPPGFFHDVEALRDTFARQVGCSSDNIAIVPSAGYGVSCAAINMPLSKGGIVLAMHEQFPSNYYAWRRQAVLSGAEFHVVNKEAGQSWADALLEAIRELGDRIEIATLEGHHWASAEFVDLEVVIPALRDVGAKVVLDLTQSIGGCPVDISRLSPDFMATSGYKWQFCPYGVAFLYVDDQYFDGVPVEEAWMNRDGAEDFSRLADFTDVAKHQHLGVVGVGDGVVLFVLGLCRHGILMDPTARHRNDCIERAGVGVARGDGSQGTGRVRDHRICRIR